MTELCGFVRSFKREEPWFFLKHRTELSARSLIWPKILAIDQFASLGNLLRFTRSFCVGVHGPLLVERRIVKASLPLSSRPNAPPQDERLNLLRMSSSTQSS